MEGMGQEQLSIMSPEWSRKGFLAEEDAEAEGRLRMATRTGRPAGERRFLRRVERRTGRELVRRKPGPKPAPGS